MSPVTTSMNRADDRDLLLAVKDVEHLALVEDERGHAGHVVQKRDLCDHAAVTCLITRHAGLARIPLGTAAARAAGQEVPFA